MKPPVNNISEIKARINIFVEYIIMKWDEINGL